MSEAGGVSVSKRFPVDMAWGEDELGERLEKALLFLPSGYAERAGGFGFRFKREPDAFAAIGTGTMLGMGILVTLFVTTARYFSAVGVVLAAVFYLAALALSARFVGNAIGAIEATAEGSELVFRVMLGKRATSTLRVHADRIVAVVVVSEEGAPPRVALGGPRHEVIAELYQTRALDPDRLASWLAEMVSLVARRASLG